MACMCGGCRNCLEAQGHELPEDCAECGAALPEDNETGFCSPACEARHLAAQRAADDAYAAQLAEEAALAAEWKRAS